MRFGNFVEHFSSVFLLVKKAAPLHQPQVLRRHRTGKSTRFGQISPLGSPLQQHLNHSQTMRISPAFSDTPPPGRAVQDLLTFISI